MGETVLDFSRDWCPKHLEPLRESWPHGAAIAMTLLFDAFVLDKTVQEMAGYSSARGTLADTGRINALLMEHAPVCCYLGDAIMKEITDEALAGHGPRLDAIKQRVREQKGG